jgi:hypothetical protein
MANRPSRILFASCSSQHYEQTLWPAIVERNATAFVWGGDAIYADDFEDLPGSSGEKVVKPATPEVLRDLYQQQLAHPGYKLLLEQNVTILAGAIDDHDSGSQQYGYREPPSCGCFLPSTF